MAPDKLAANPDFPGENHSEGIIHNSKTAVLLIGHGSRAPGANDAQFLVARDLQESGRYSIVECAFLEINQPDIPTGLSLCRRTGVTGIVVVPYFLHMGTHVQRDLPRIIGDWWVENPEIEIMEGAPLGYSPKITELVEERIGQVLASHSPV